MASSPLDPLVILKLTKLFDWLHDPLLQLFAHILLARLSSSIFRGGGGGGGLRHPGPPLILKLTKLFTWLHDPLLVIYSHSLALVIFVNIPGAYT